MGCKPMRAVNRFRITRFADHLVLRLGFSESEKCEDFGDQVEEILLPITTVTNLALKLFECVIQSTVDITQFFTALQEPMAKLNALSAEANKQKDRAASGQTSPATKAGT